MNHGGRGRAADRCDRTKDLDKNGETMMTDQAKLVRWITFLFILANVGVLVWALCS